MNNILIMSISAKVPLIKSIIRARNKFDKDSLIIGSDMNELNISNYFVDKFFRMKKISELNIKEFTEFCQQHEIKYIIPTRDEDVVYLAKYKDALLLHEIFSFVSDIKSVEFCFDKLMFYKNRILDSIIPTYLSINDIKEDFCVIKERFGAGSVLIELNIRTKNALKVSEKFNNPVFQPYIKGTEYSIDSYVDNNGKCIASVIRSRDLIVNGEAKITTTIKNEKLKNTVIDFLEGHAIKGHSVVQVIKNKNDYYIIECNSRFGGASTLSEKLGMESFYWFLCESNNKKITADLKSFNLKQVRISKDIYFEC